ncbi:GTP-binding protein [Plasmodium gonderi]|uniref:GTP-binding protein n=1 Tax=Plasmodium gonderi TaxID=77519 RepID=A0A1Y1JM04_PLAGO|nr:GTP-binding protein [Plasmodium gonderi]GAW82495.1 GTP-binding protein [Plasmodium gonderi]
MFSVILKNAFQKTRYKITSHLNSLNLKVTHISSQNCNNLNIEKDYFYINPLRKLTCIGCGEFLQTTNEKKSGYIPFNVYEKYSNGRIKFYTKVKGEEVSSVPDGVKVDVNNFPNFRIKTKIVLCKRCYRLQHYKTSDTQCEVDTNRIENIFKCRKQLQEEVKHCKISKVNQGEKKKNTLNMNTSNTKHSNGSFDEKENFDQNRDLQYDTNDHLICHKKNNPFVKRKLNKYFGQLTKNRIHKEGEDEYMDETEKMTRDVEKNAKCEENENSTSTQENNDAKEDCMKKEEERVKKNILINEIEKKEGKMGETIDAMPCKERYYQDPSYNIDQRSVNIYEKKDILKKRNDMKKLDVEKMQVSTAKYVQGDRNHIMNNLIKKMKRKSLVLYLIDITNIENTILPELYIGCKNKDINIIWLVNKVDCLPKSTNLEIVKIWFRNLVRQIKNAHINDLIFISALKFYNYNMLEERMKYYVDLEKGTDIYIVGCVNVGKSSFVNSFLKYINYKHIGDIYNKRKKGGVTTSNIPYTTLNYNIFQLKKNIKIIDTVGIPTKYQYSSILYKDIDLNSICINKRIQPFTYKLKEDSSIILGSLCYINLIYGDFSLLTFYISNKVTIHMCKSEKVEEFLNKKKCSFLYPPHIKTDFDLLKPFVKHTVKMYGKDFESVDDIVISDLCWFSLTGRGVKILEIYAPKNIKIYRRPSMINDAIKHTQVDVFKYKSYRGRTAKVLRKKKKLIEQLDRINPSRRQEMKNITLQSENEQLHNLHMFNDSCLDSTTSPTSTTSTTSASLIEDKKDLESIIHYL